ncbi:MAG: Gfo/Idh/MocA family protein [Candidatus Fimadaptatus sp.]|jgi:scyllo-inositol 2-dehydrogenase (NADP+)
MKKLRVAIIGQGRSGRDIHGAFFRSEENEKYEVVAVVDALADRRERAKAEYGCDVYDDYRKLYDRKDIDLVINSTFSHMHYHVSMDLLTHGFNVVVEKPFSAHKEECAAMIRAAREHNVMLCVFQQSHFAPYYRRIREILDSGVLGRPVQISISFNGFARRWDWQCSQRFYGGSLRNTGPHPMEQALDLLDMDELPQVISRLDSVNSFGDAEDYVKILLLAPNKPVIDVEISSCDAYNEGYLYKIQCSRGTLRAKMNEITYQYFVPEEAPEQHLILEPLCKPDGTPAYCGEKLEWHKEVEEVVGTSFNAAVKAYYDNIYEHLTEGKELIIKPEKIMQQIELMEEVHRQNPMPIRF